MPHVSLRAVPALVLLAVLAPAAEQRPLAVDDLFALKSVGAPVLSSDGSQVAYTVRAMDLKKDSSDTDIYLIPTAGGEAVRLTTSPKSENTARISSSMNPVRRVGGGYNAGKPPFAPSGCIPGQNPGSTPRIGARPRPVAALQALAHKDSKDACSKARSRHCGPWARARR